MNKKNFIVRWRKIKENGHIRKKRRELVKNVIFPTLEKNSENKTISVSQTTPNHENDTELNACDGVLSNQNIVEDSESCSSENVLNNWENELEDDGFLQSSTSEIADDNRLLIQHSLAHWSVNHSITRAALNDLLALINDVLPDLNIPKDARTIVATPRARMEIIEDGNGGSYWHYGLEKALKNCLENVDYRPKVEININVDGLPLFRSSKTEFWPILINFHKQPEISPMIVGIYSGKGKPKNIDWMMTPFVNEFLAICLEGGISINGKKTKVKIRCIICDTPARSFLKGKICK